MEYKSLHSHERPIAMLSSLHANSQRDPKKAQKPYTYLDFSFYKPRNSEDTPQSHYGSAYAELVRTKRLPAWALFCFKSLMSSVDESYVPSEPALIAQDALLLHPEKSGDSYKGLLIALESAGDQRRVFRNSKGDEILLTVPYVDTKVIARENTILTP